VSRSTAPKFQPAPQGGSMRKVVGGIIGLSIVAVMAFVMLGASQQVELYVSVPEGVTARVNGKPLLPCKHEVSTAKNKRCDPKEDAARDFRWFVNEGKTYELTATGPGGEATLKVPVEDVPVTVKVGLDDDELPVFRGPR
jgi:hypothetical protein